MTHITECCRSIFAPDRTSLGSTVAFQELNPQNECGTKTTAGGFITGTSLHTRDGTPKHSKRERSERLVASVAMQKFCDPTGVHAHCEDFQVFSVDAATSFVDVH